MDPLASSNVDLVKAVQALLVKQGSAIDGSLLMNLLGQDVDVLLQAVTADGVKLQLPSGQTVTAQGELPYPEGTQLRVRILPSESGQPVLRMQLQEARPPAPPTLLSPLIQGEAQTLVTRLTQEALPADLIPLMRLLSVVADTPSGTQSQPMPSLEALQASLQALPGPLKANLAQVLGMQILPSATETDTELATSLRTLFQEVANALPSESPDRALNPVSPDQMGKTEDVQKPLQMFIQQVLARVQTLIAQHPEIPEDHKDFLTAWIRGQLMKSAAAEPAPQIAPKPLTAMPTPNPAATGRPVNADSLIPSRLMATLAVHPGSKGEQPISWESWIRGTVMVLTDSAVSPQEAAFHAVQAKEGTAFFEIPLPWAHASSPLQIWVESDAPEDRQSARDTTKRVLLGLNFSQLGETRLGLAQGGPGLQIRIWTEHPDAIESQRERMESELKDLGKPFNLRIFALTYGPDGTIPSIRSLAVGPSLRALG